MIVDETVAISENRKVNGKYYKLTFRSKALSRAVQPGQFINVKVTPAGDPFLRRPFSYYRVSGNEIEVLYEVLGRGTALLAQKKKEETLQITGPHGLSFTQNIKKKKRILVAGGVGVPPLLFLAEKCKTDFILIGTKSKAEVLPRAELKRAKGEILYSTNDGSYGTKGYVTVLLEQLIKKDSPENFFIQTCGPTVMMDAVIQIAKRAGIEGEASLDKPMACAVGACLGCMVKTHEGWVPSCVKGPVFAFKDLVGQI